MLSNRITCLLLSLCHGYVTLDNSDISGTPRRVKEPRFFESIFNMLGLPKTVRSYLIAELTREGRYYHALGHIALMIRFFRHRLDLQYFDPKEVEFAKRHLLNWMIATLFHDVVYDPKASKGENERLSAVEFRLRLSGYKPPNHVLFRSPIFNPELIEQMILNTISHELRDGLVSDGEAAVDLFLRADLAILWTPKLSTYQWYARGVRMEYGHVPNDEYLAGRGQVLETLSTVQKHITLPEIANLTRNFAWEQTALSEGLLDV